MPIRSTLVFDINGDMTNKNADKKKEGHSGGVDRRESITLMGPTVLYEGLMSSVGALTDLAVELRQSQTDSSADPPGLRTALAISCVG